MSHFDRNPFIVIWEVTRACALRCLHCRAEAQYRRDPRELSTEEGKSLIRGLREMNSPILVFTGGDPLMREDLFELAAYAKEQGLHVSLTPSATPRVKPRAMRRAKEVGLDRWAFSLDGSTAEIHDWFRGTRGSYNRTIKAIQYLRELEMPLQINTTVSKYNLDDLSKLAELMESMGVVLWSVFFLVPTGRGRTGDMISPEEHEQVFHWLADLSSHVCFDIKTTAAPVYRRVLAQRGALKGGGDMRAPYSVNDGNGFVFVSHIGEVFPSGFLPIPCGNVRKNSLVEIYREHPLFQSLRDPDQLKGKCGICKYRLICGGSRACAYALTGDPLASDPTCIYLPAVDQVKEEMDRKGRHA
ncbi:radical SAM/SPASM domain-containing protein [Paludifilum halophilum]|uniref:Radical SAM/SPASM domain-containing protein n=1 Tax=Paludifilum halophilum TaxID=1642702 RepID=A0A235B303_9BACL|nr:radical SAM/SPASM domain-containing protein [Paludifilum halophilum]OYD06664.1 radical SAM/SPASM domain-containing protein [Paludifilum halophilum]